MKKKSGRAPFTFSLVLSPDRRVPEPTPDFEAAIYEAGADDALLGFRNGVAFLDYDREGPSLLRVVLDAIGEVERAGVRIVRVEPDDLVTAAEIARRTGRSRQSIHLLSTGKRGGGNFPPPVACQKHTSPLWRWADVVEWLAVHGGWDEPGVTPSLIEDARTLATVNHLLGLRAHLRLIPYELWWLARTELWAGVLRGDLDPGQRLLRVAEPRGEYRLRHP